ncbi:response regulator transcription factor [Carnobacterium gallinarum]|uniref:response regulator transcription factor n=1 Tax=Carnobacterium gallinarum TaxID=2749 RepID=UPI0005531A71|nr:response regulator transcription factor [Carnobacterium gallinarum]
MTKVLIIEDDHSIASLQKDYLEISGIEAEIVVDGKEGLTKALSEEFDLIVVDVMLPSMNGFDICKEIRKEKQIPILIISAKNEDIDKIRGLGIGADDYMTKPFSPNEMVARVQSHIKRYQLLTKPQNEANTLIERKGLVIDKDARKVFILNEEFFFTTKEFDLLLFLAEHPNRVWNKEQLFQQVWEVEAYDTDVSTVVVHIKKIREKIKNGHLSDSPIETIWGSGYRFNV